MDITEHRDLLEELRQMAGDADSTADIRSIFLPLQIHNQALAETTLVVRGERGTGKTALFRLLTELHGDPAGLRKLFPAAHLPESRWVEGFSQSSLHPTVEILDAFSQSANDEQLRLLWTVHLVGVLHEAGIGRAPRFVLDTWRANRNEPEEWVSAARSQLGVLLQWLDDLDRKLSSEGSAALVTYDHLDRIGLLTAKVRQRYSGTLLALWHSLSTRYKRLRPKIFMREDLFEASERAFADASKLRARSVSLSWDRESLYRLLVRHMAALSKSMRSWIRRGNGGVPLTQLEGLLGWFPPFPFPEQGDGSYSGFVAHLAGEVMGAGAKKGYTYRWVLNHIQDAHVRVVPRSLINLIGNAARLAIERGPKGKHENDQLLHPTELGGALEATSRTRVIELAEEYKVVSRLKQLEGMTLMLSPKEVERRLSARPDEDDGFGGDGRSVMDELVKLGVLRVRDDGRIDVPDIYRYGFGIKRKGGVKRPD